MFVASDIKNGGFPIGKAVVLRKCAAILISGVTGMTGVVMFFGFLQSIGAQSGWQIILIFILFLLMTGMGASVWNSRPRVVKEYLPDAPKPLDR